MILDAVLLTVRTIVSTQRRDVAIIPEMRLGPAKGVRISDPGSGTGLRLTGKVDYAIFEYENVKDDKCEYQILLLHLQLLHGLVVSNISHERLDVTRVFVSTNSFPFVSKYVWIR
jgi:hypothetical protein